MRVVTGKSHVGVCVCLTAFLATLSSSLLSLSRPPSFLFPSFMVFLPYYTDVCVCTYNNNYHSIALFIPLVIRVMHCFVLRRSYVVSTCALYVCFVRHMLSQHITPLMCLALLITPLFSALPFPLTLILRTVQ